MQRTIFAFYNPNGIDWKYEDMPSGWWWVGCGSTSPVGEFTPKYYTREEQFSGPESNFDEMMQYLKVKFDGLLENGSVKRFHLNETYSF